MMNNKKQLIILILLTVFYYIYTISSSSGFVTLENTNLNFNGDPTFISIDELEYVNIDDDTFFVLYEYNTGTMIAPLIKQLDDVGNILNEQLLNDKYLVYGNPIFIEKKNNIYFRTSTDIIAYDTHSGKSNVLENINLSTKEQFTVPSGDFNNDFFMIQEEVYKNQIISYDLYLQDKTNSKKIFIKNSQNFIYDTFNIVQSNDKNVYLRFGNLDFYFIDLETGIVLTVDNNISNEYDFKQISTLWHNIDGKVLATTRNGKILLLDNEQNTEFIFDDIMYLDIYNILFIDEYIGITTVLSTSNPYNSTLKIIDFKDCTISEIDSLTIDSNSFYNAVYYDEQYIYIYYYSTSSKKSSYILLDSENLTFIKSIPIELNDSIDERINPLFLKSNR